MIKIPTLIGILNVFRLKMIQLFHVKMNGWIVLELVESHKNIVLILHQHSVTAPTPTQFNYFYILDII